MATQCARQPPHEGGEHGPVRPVQAWSWVGAAQDGDLVAQHEELDVLGGGRPAQQHDVRVALAGDTLFVADINDFASIKTLLFRARRTASVSSDGHTKMRATICSDSIFSEVSSTSSPYRNASEPSSSTSSTSTGNAPGVASGTTVSASGGCSCSAFSWECRIWRSVGPRRRHRQRRSISASGSLSWRRR